MEETTMRILLTAVAALILTGSAAATVKLIPPIKIKDKPAVAKIEKPKVTRPGVHSLPLVG
jgi:hypothetical protein